MPKLPIDISGRRGLIERHQGDVNDTAPAAHLRYTGEDGQFADGIFNPIKTFGFINPSNAVYASLTGTIGAPINSIVYDAQNDIVYLSEAGENILKLDSLSDTSLVNFQSFDSGDELKDMLMYEIAGTKALTYLLDKGSGTGQVLGFRAANDNEGAKIGNYPIQTADSLDETTVVDTATGISQEAEGRRLAQSFVAGTDTSGALEATGIRVRIRRSAGTGTGITIRFSIQAQADPNAGIFTSQGAWANSTAYSVNDTVTDGGETYMCHTAHTSATGTDRPGVDAGWPNKWALFGAPDGTQLATVDVDLSTVIEGTAETLYDDLSLELSTAVTLTDGDTYWLVMEEQGSNMTASDGAAWLRTDSLTAGNTLTEGNYARKFTDVEGTWSNVKGLTDTENQFDFSLYDNRIDNVTNAISSGNIAVATGTSGFLFLSENALVYWFSGSRVHTFDGGITGGPTGRLAEDALQFPSYIEIVDVAETRAQMYIGIQSSDISSGNDDDFYSARTIGIFIWNRRSQVFGGTEFYPAPGAKEIKNVFTSSDGTVKAITVNNSGFAEIRAVSGNQYAVIHTLEKNGFPESRNGIGYLNGMAVWTGKNGITYVYGAVAVGEPEQLYKIGDISGEAGDGQVFTPGPIFVGHNESTEPRSAVLQAWSDDTPTYSVSKWYPHGDGTISTVAQTGNAGNVFTKVERFPIISKMNYAHIYFVPIEGGIAATTVATIKVYENHKSTATKEFTINQKELAKGYKYLPLGGERNVFAVQFEIEWTAANTLGSFDFQPSTIVVDYSESTRLK